MKKHVYKVGEPAPSWNDKENWSAWFKSFIEYHNKNKRPNSYNIIFPEVIKIMNQEEKVKPRVLIRMIKEELPELNGSQISRVIKRMISYGILEYLVRKSYKHIIKGHYWNSHVK